MCPGSLRAHENEDAVPGVKYEISQTNYAGGSHRHGVLHRPGYGRDSWGIVKRAACIRVPTDVMLTGIPATMQHYYGIGPVLVGVLLPGEEASDGDRPDMIDCGQGHHPLPLFLFADLDVSLELVDESVTQASVSAPNAATVRALEPVLEQA